MRYLALFIALLVSCPALAKATCEDQNPDVASAIQALTAEKSRDDIARLFDVFMAHPQEAACKLVNELKVVKVHIIKPDEARKFKSTMHVIWSLRALRYITRCQDFRAGTNEHFGSKNENKLEKARAQFLTRGGFDKTPFFSVWMSRDIIFVAALDAQSSIIHEWKLWLSRNHDFEFESCSDFNEWYF